MDGLEESFISSPEGLIKYFIISAPGDNDRDFSCSYETAIFPRGRGVRCGNHYFDSKNNISLWMLYQHPGEKYSLDNEKALVAEIVSSCNRGISLKVEEHEKLIAKIEARDNYVRSENDTKAFIFSDKNYYIIITEDGVQIIRGVSTHYSDPGDFYERNISESKEYLAEEYWQLIPVVATADNEEAMEVLDLFMKNTTDDSLSALMRLRSYMKSKVCV